MSHFNATNVTGRDMTADGVKIDDIISNDFNTGLGKDNLTALLPGDGTNTKNIVVGSNCLSAASGTIVGNVAVGNEILTDSATVALGNIGIGNQSLQKLTTGLNNVCIGGNILSNIPGCSNNIAIGNDCLKNSTSGNQNIVLGSNSLEAVSSASLNVIIGTSVCPQLSQANSNVIIGNGAMGAELGIVNNAVAIGREAIGRDNTVSVGDSANASGTGAIAIGNGATASAANAVAIGNGASNSVAGSVLLSGDVRISGNSALSSETVSVAGGAVRDPSVSETISFVSITAGAGNATGTLADGSIAGQLKYFVVTGAAGPSYVVTVTSGVAPSGGVLSTITFSSRGEGVTLVWSGSDWYVLNTGATLA